MEAALVYLAFMATYFALSPYVFGMAPPLPWRRGRGEIEGYVRPCERWLALAVTALTLVAALLMLLAVWLGPRRYS